MPAGEIDPVPEVGRQRLVDAPRCAAPGLHRGCGLDVEKLQITHEQRRRHVEHVGRHQEIDEHRLQDLVAEIAREPAQIEHRAHADIVVGVERVQELRPRAVEPAEPFHPGDSLLESHDLGPQLAPDVGVEIVRVNPAAVAHAVIEPRVDELDAVPPHQQEDVVVDRGDARGDGNIERDRGSVVLGHVGGHRVAADPVRCLEDAEIEPVGMTAQRPRRAEPRHARTDNRHTSRHRLAPRVSPEPTPVDPEKPGFHTTTAGVRRVMLGSVCHAVCRFHRMIDAVRRVSCNPIIFWNNVAPKMQAQKILRRFRISLTV